MASARSPDNANTARAEPGCSFCCLWDSDKNEFKPKDLQTEEKESKGLEDTTEREQSMQLRARHWRLGDQWASTALPRTSGGRFLLSKHTQQEAQAHSTVIGAATQGYGTDDLV